jgi:hypothetical protein
MLFLPQLLHLELFLIDSKPCTAREFYAFIRSGGWLIIRWFTSLFQYTVGIVKSWKCFLHNTTPVENEKKVKRKKWILEELMRNKVNRVALPFNNARGLRQTFTEIKMLLFAKEHCSTEGSYGLMQSKMVMCRKLLRRIHQSTRFC